MVKGLVSESGVEVTEGALLASRHRDTLLYVRMRPQAAKL